MSTSSRLKSGIVISYQYMGASGKVQMKDSDTNVVSVYIEGEKIRLIKLCQSTCALVGEIVSYTILAIDEGTQGISDVFIKDELPKELEFIENSLKVDDCYVPGNITEGIFLGVFTMNQFKKITFNVRVKELPSSSSFQNKVTGYYLLNGNQEYIESNVTSLNIEKLSSCLNLKASKKYVRTCDYVRYKIRLMNTGSLSIKKTFLFIKAQEGLRIDWSSLTVNNRLDAYQKIKNGILLNDLKPNESYIIDYWAKVTDEKKGLKTIVKAQGLIDCSCQTDTLGSCIKLGCETYTLIPLKEICFQQHNSIKIPLFKPVKEVISYLEVDPILKDVSIIYDHSCGLMQPIIKTKILFNCNYKTPDQEVTLTKLEKVSVNIDHLGFQEIVEVKVTPIIKEYYYESLTQEIHICLVLLIQIEGI